MSVRNRRFVRKLLMVIAAMAALVWVAMDQFGIAPSEIAELFLGVLLTVAVVIGAAAVAMLLWLSLRRLIARLRD